MAVNSDYTSVNLTIFQGPIRNLSRIEHRDILCKEMLILDAVNEQREYFCPSERFDCQNYSGLISNNFRLKFRSLCAQLLFRSSWHRFGIAVEIYFASHDL